MIRGIKEFTSILRNRKMTASDLDELRADKLRSILRNAYEHVPYYRSLFRRAGIFLDDIRTLADLENVPVSTKESLRAAGINRITARWLDPSACVSAVTGGSTGKPWTVYWTQSERRTIVMLALASLISMGFGPLDRLVVLGWPRKMPRSFYQRLGLYRSWEILASTPVDEQILRLKELKPTILKVYPTVLRALIHTLDSPLRDLIHPRILIHSAEVFDQVLRQRVKADLDAELFNYYAAREIGPIAWECPSHEGLHLNAAHYIVEFPNLDRPTEMPNARPAVITSLISYAMPLIRYNVGDIIAPIDKSCSCGCAFPLIGHPIGRDNDVVRMPSGKMLSPQRFEHILRGFDGIDQWRLIQEHESQFTLKLVMPVKPGEEVLRGIRSEFLAYLAEPVSLSIEMVDYMSEEGKFRAFISDVDAPEI